MALAVKFEGSIALVLMVLTVFHSMDITSGQGCQHYMVCIGPNEDIVHIVQDVLLNRLSSLDLSHDEHSFMRAMAYAESHDGDCAGGLWGVTGEMITTIKKNKTLLDRYGKDYCNTKPECTGLGMILTVENMKNPEYSGLAAALYLKYIAEKHSRTVPNPDNATRQYYFWKEHFNGTLNKEDFVELATNGNLNKTLYSYLIFKPNETGPGVVQDVVDLLGFVKPTMKCLLRRIALVETRDGRSDNLPGGIWAVDKDKLKRVRSIRRGISRYASRIARTLCLHLTSTQIIEVLNTTTSTNIPFYSGVAAYVYLESLDVIIPGGYDIEGQARFWKDHYHIGSMTTNEFVQIVKGIPLNETDETHIPGANGSDVVEAVISKLGLLENIGPDHRFMRRLAYVETRDGAVENEGGIWGVDDDKLGQIREALNDQTARGHTELNAATQDITSKCEVDLESSLYMQQMSIPLYSGLTARLVLYLWNVSRREAIPLAGNVTGQAHFWASQYHQGGDQQHFLKRVLSLESRSGCRINADIFFVLDVSGSILNHFKSVIRFERDFISNISRIGPNHTQIGTIIFNNTAQILFDLDTYSSKETLDKALGVYENITTKGSTNIVDGLCKMMSGFTVERGARASSTVLKVAIILTDGRSNTQENTCNFYSTKHAADEVHKDLDPILIFVIGVTNKVRGEELESIATLGEYTHLDSFNKQLLIDSQLEHTDAVCDTASIGLPINEETGRTLGANGTFRCNFPLPESGITITVCISRGQLLVFGSLSIPNPNPSYNDFFINLHLDNGSHALECKSVFVPSPEFSCISPPLSSEGSARKRSVPESQHQTQSSRVVYLSIIGKGEVNVFVVNSTGGNIVHDETTPSISPGSCKTCTGKNVGVVTASTVSSLLFLLLVVVVVAVVVYHHSVVYQRKKMREKEVEDYKKLLDLPDGVDYAEYCEDT